MLHSNQTWAVVHAKFDSNSHHCQQRPIHWSEEETHMEIYGERCLHLKFYNFNRIYHEWNEKTIFRKPKYFLTRNHKITQKTRWRSPGFEPAPHVSVSQQQLVPYDEHTCQIQLSYSQARHHHRSPKPVYQDALVWHLVRSRHQRLACQKHLDRAIEAGLEVWKPVF